MCIRRFRWHRLGSLTILCEFFYRNFIIIIIVVVVSSSLLKYKEMVLAVYAVMSVV